jgi:nickel-type superoxide dismutase maturation protease
VLLGRAASARGRRRAYRQALGAAAAVAAVALVLVRRLPRVVVEGPSMRPGLQPGDRLVLVPRRHHRPGTVVAAADPRQPDRWLVKRVAAVGTDGRLHLRGDDPAASTDSRAFGPVEPDQVWGRAVWRYAPRGRTGRVR